MSVIHAKKVNSFPHLVKRLLNETKVWDSVYVATNVESLLPRTFEDGEMEWFLYVNVYYTNEDGIDDMTTFLYRTHNWEWLLEMEEQARKVLPAIFA